MYLQIIKISDITYSEYEKTYALLSAEEQERIDRKKKAADKKCSLAAFFLLNRMLKEYYGIDKVDISRTQTGKPYLLDSNIYFSISHSGEYVAVATNESEIGIDVERVRECRADVKQRICTETELSYIGSDDIKFLTVWTIKEAAVKMTGIGVKGLRKIELDFSGGNIFVNLAGAKVETYRENDLIVSICKLNK